MRALFCLVIFPMSYSKILSKILVLGVSLAFAYVALRVYLVGIPVFGLAILALGLGFLVIYGSRRFYAARFIYPGVLTVGLFIIFPILYTLFLGFTNYSSFNLLTQERATDVLLLEKIVDKQSERPFSVTSENEQYRIFFPEGNGGYLSDPTPLDGTEITLETTLVSTTPETFLALKEILPLKSGLAAVSIELPDGSILRQNGLRSFAGVTPRYERTDEGLRDTQTGAMLRADQTIGFYVNEAGEKQAPGWRVGVGLKNFNTMIENKGIREPFVAIFIWTVVFAALSVLLTFAVGVLLATALQWEHLRGKAIYRVLLILPYAVPSFISILVFRGLFNPNFGEINLILEGLFGIRPEWWSNPWLARTMVLIVNTWLGYPYMMLLAMGFLQAVPQDQKKAAILEGATAIRVFFTITLPQIIPPFLPLLLASFAFNFNNLVLILLLTNGGPDMAGTQIPAGQTDILASFMYRIAFDSSGQQFGLASAITFVIFILVTIIAYGNFRALRKAA